MQLLQWSFLLQFAFPSTAHSLTRAPYFGYCCSAVSCLSHFPLQYGGNKPVEPWAQSLNLSKMPQTSGFNFATEVEGDGVMVDYFPMFLRCGDWSATPHAGANLQVSQAIPHLLPQHLLQLYHSMERRTECLRRFALHRIVRPAQDCSPCTGCACLALVVFALHWLCSACTGCVHPALIVLTLH